MGEIVFSEGILDDVVHQFSEPLALLRELVQNGIDAGTGEIEVSLAYVEGRAVIGVQDWGEGMSREIIETKLLRLFRSGKDDDLTKIGRFGIGFVSVFAIQPDAVVVDTGREGQSWRVLFGEDRRYELRALPYPVEGTWVRLFKSMSPEEFEELMPRAREELVKWCKHASVPIYVDGEDVREAFDMTGTLKITYQEEGTRVVMGFCDEGSPFAGYYNRGLTLKETQESPWAWVKFKIDSRYLEHTLTRDQLLEDVNREKAFELLGRLATEEMPERLLVEMEGAVERGEAARVERCAGYLARFLSHGGEPPRGWKRRKILLSARGEGLEVQRVERSGRRSRLWRVRPRVVVEGEGPDGLVVVGAAGVKRLLGLLVGEVEELHANEETGDGSPGVTAVGVEDVKVVMEGSGRPRQSEVEEDFGAAVAGLLERLGLGLREVYLVHRELDEGRAVLVEVEGEELRWETARGLPTLTWEEVQGAAGAVIFERSDPGVARWLQEVRQEPEWAAYVALETNLAVPDDRLLRAAVAARKERLT